MDKVYTGSQAAQIVAAVTLDAYLIGIDVAFHAVSFIHLLHTYGLGNRTDPPWRRYLVDVRTEVGGALGLPLHKRGVNELAAALGIDLSRYTRHQAADEAASPVTCSMPHPSGTGLTRSTAWSCRRKWALRVDERQHHR